MPLQSDAPGTVAQPEPDMPRILVVEDNDNLREATVDFLKQQGHQVTGVVCAEDVDDTPTRDLPDLYLIDVNLPGENGFSLVERIRQSQPLAGIDKARAIPSGISHSNTELENTSWRHSAAV